MYVDFEHFTNLLNESDFKVDETRNSSSVSNKFVRPQGILVQDTFNNPFFPIGPRPKLDTSKLDVIEIYKRYREEYSLKRGFLLPWHYCVEMVDDQYVAINTRPLDMKFPINSYEANKLEWKDNWDHNTKDFIDSNLFDISDAIHIAVVGDTKIDVYPRKIYEIIGRICIVPTLRRYNLPGGLYSRVFGLNLNKKFNLEYISRFIRS